MLAVLFVLAMIAGVLFWQFNSDPEWWRPPDPADPAVEQLGFDVQNFVVSKLHEERDPDHEWRMRLTDDQVNAWLAVNLPQWFENQTGRKWPGGLSMPLISSSSSGLSIGVRTPSEFGGRVVSLNARGTIEDGQLRLNLNKVSLGQLSLPAFAQDEVFTWLREQGEAGVVSPNDAEFAMRVLSGADTLTPQVELADGRLVELLHLETEEHSVLMTLRTKR